MPKNFIINEIIDPIKKRIFNSPFARLLLEDIGIMKYTDRNSGRTFSQSVVFDQDLGVYWLVKEKTDSFWLNFQGGSPVVVKFQGNDFKGWAEITQEPEMVRAIFAHIMSEPRHSVKFLDKDLDLSDTLEDAQMNIFSKKYQILVVRTQAAG